MNGRPGKAGDSCYSWWTLAAAKLLDEGQEVPWGLLQSLLQACWVVG